MVSLLWTIFLFLIVGSITFSMVLMHHWGYYGIKGNKKIFAKSLYFAGVLFFLAVIAMALILYQSTL